MKQLFFILIMYSSFSLSGQKTKPTTVEFSAENNTTVISFKKEKDFILPGKWKKYQETVDKWKFYLMSKDSIQIGVAKRQQKKAPYYKKGMQSMGFLKKYIAEIKKGFSNEKTKYDFIVLDEDKDDDYKYYKVSSIESEPFINSKPTWIFKTMNLVGIKNGIVYDLSAFVNEGNESEMKSLLMQLYIDN